MGQSRFSRVIFGLVGAGVGVIGGLNVNDLVSDDRIRDAHSYASAVAEAYRLEKYQKISPSQAVDELVGKFESPEAISKYLAENTDPTIQPSQPSKSPDDKWVDADDQLREIAILELQAEEKHVKQVAFEAEKLVEEFGRSRVLNRQVPYAIGGAVLGVILGAMIPDLLARSWGFVLSRLRELSLAIQGKN